MPLPRVTLVLQIHHNTVLYVTVLGYTTASTSPYSSVNHLPGSHRFYKSTIHISMSLPKVTLPCCITITILHSTSPLWDTLLAVQYHILLQIQPPVSHFFYKYITILHTVSLPCVTLLLQLHNHTRLYITTMGHTSLANTSP